MGSHSCAPLSSAARSLLFHRGISPILRLRVSGPTVLLMSASGASVPGTATRPMLARGLLDARRLRAIRLPEGAEDAARKEANSTIAMGLGIGAFGAASLALVGATCPLCVVAAPALVSWGLYKRLRARRAR